jgi:hypothetical protein
MWQTRSGAGATAVELAGALLLAVAVTDALGHAAASFYLLLLAVPVTAAAALVCFARVVDHSGGGGDPLGRLQALLATLLVFSIVVGAAIRAPVLPEGAVPGLASGALAVAFGVLILQALLSLGPARSQSA